MKNKPSIPMWALLSLVLAGWAGGCKGAGGTGPVRSAAGNVHHIVVCWLKQPGDPAARQELIEASKQFADLPGVLDVRAGPVLKSDRKIADATFDVAIVMTLEDAAALASYLEHPRHKQAVKETLVPLTDKVVVYDFIE